MDGWRDGWRLAVGTLTAVPVRPPGRVDAAVARRSALLAPLAVLPLGVAVGLVLLLGRELGLNPLATAVVAVAALALGNRAFHLDGLSDTADGLAASYDRERSLAVMRSGSSGPAGVVATVLVLGVQAACLAELGLLGCGPVLAGVLVCVSRGALAPMCLPVVPAARESGLATSYAGSQPAWSAALLTAGLTAVTCLAVALAGFAWWRGLVAVAVAGLVVAVLLRRAVRRFGGVTGDVFGAGIELALAALLVSLT